MIFMDLNNVENYGLHLQTSQLLITRKLKAVNIIIKRHFSRRRTTIFTQFLS